MFCSELKLISIDIIYVLNNMFTTLLICIFGPSLSVSLCAKSLQSAAGALVHQCVQ